MYTAPSLESLKHSVNNLPNQYQGPHDALVKKIYLLSQWCYSSQNESETYLTALVFGYLAISKVSYKQTNYGLFNHGSRLASLLEQALNITSENQLNDDDKLIYLTHLLTRLNQFDTNRLCANQESIDLFYGTQTDLKNLLTCLLSHADLQDLLNDIPSVKSLTEDFETLPINYRSSKASKNIEDNPERIALIQFLEIIAHLCEKQNFNEALVQHENKYNEIVTLNLAFQIKYGALLYLMIQIESEYFYTSPENSKLYQFCQQASLLKHSDEARIKCECFFALLNFLPQVVLHLKHLKENNETSDYLKMAKTFSEVNAKLIASIQIKLVDLIGINLKKIEKNNNSLLRTISNIINMTTHYGFSIAATTAVTTAAWAVIPISAVSAIGVSATCTYLGNRYFGSLGSVAANRIGLIVEGAVTQVFVENAVATPIQGAVRNTLGDMVGDSIYYTLNIPKSLYNQAMRYMHPTKTKNVYANRKCIQTLLLLPASVFSEDKKTKLRKISLGAINDVSNREENKALAPLLGLRL